ncbi:UDP-glucosyltransferase 2-like isoform X5 [Episyrphus balteatus]|uniref:UDP-glucosyltransferase 2-like isoform X5 n=1 Tax=Episyrphus balteatus TaxID=286459 RepID=UPI0024859632|nr:UDP-glucosyltransferase 2-like isoform X5 [Episyrphus balteatus]
MSERYVFQLILIFVIICHFQVNQSANVLCMFTSPNKPNLKVYMAVANTLIERNHNLTIVTTIPIPLEYFPRKDFRHVLLKIPLEKVKILNYRNARDVLKQKEFQEFFKEDNKFDLVILGYLLNDFMVGVAPRYGCPIAVISLGGPFGEVAEWIGNPSAISYVQIPHTGKSQQMSFMERYQNLLLHAFVPFVEAYMNRVMENIYRTLFTDESYPPYSDVISNISLVLYNRHFSEMPVRPLVPALVEIGGIQDEDQSEYLPQVSFSSMKYQQICYS